MQSTLVWTGVLQYHPLLPTIVVINHFSHGCHVVWMQVKVRSNLAIPRPNGQVESVWSHQALGNRTVTAPGPFDVEVVGLEERAPKSAELVPVYWWARVSLAQETGAVQ